MHVIKFDYKFRRSLQGHRHLLKKDTKHRASWRPRNKANRWRVVKKWLGDKAIPVMNWCGEGW